MEDSIVLLGYEGWTMVFDHLGMRGVAKSKMWLVDKNISSMVSIWFRRWTTKWGPRFGDKGFYIPTCTSLPFNFFERKWQVDLTDIDPRFDDWTENNHLPFHKRTSRRIRQSKLKTIRGIAKGHNLPINTDGLRMTEAASYVLRLSPLYRKGLLNNELSAWSGRRAIVVKKIETLMNHMRTIWANSEGNSDRRKWFSVWRCLIWGY